MLDFGVKKLDFGVATEPKPLLRRAFETAGEFVKEAPHLPTEIGILSIFGPAGLKISRQIKEKIPSELQGVMEKTEWTMVAPKFMLARIAQDIAVPLMRREGKKVALETAVGLKPERSLIEFLPKEFRQRHPILTAIGGLGIDFTLMLSPDIVRSLSPAQLSTQATRNIVDKALQNPRYQNIIKEMSRRTGGKLSPEEAHTLITGKVFESMQKLPYPKRLNLALGEAGLAKIGKKRLLKPKIKPEKISLISKKQISQISAIADKKLLISEKGKFKPQFKFLAEQMTGKKDIKEMTKDEAKVFTSALEKLEPKFGKPPKIPRKKELITQEFAEKIPTLREIGLKERFRPAHKVFEKMGLKKEVFEPAFSTEIKLFEELNAFRKEAFVQQATVGKTPESSQRIFRAIEQTLTKEDMAKLTPEEVRVATWGRKFFNKWADRLNLSEEQRRTNYITHIFEKEVQENLKTKYPLDLDLVRAMEFITPKTIFNPFLQQRLGKTVGLKEDFWSAIEAYEARELKVFHYEPLIKRIRVYEKFLPPNSARYLREYVARITNRPLVLDRELKQDITELANIVSKLPGGEVLGALLKQGNAGGMLAYNFTGALYEMFLGLRPASAIKNLSQNALTVAEIGAKNFLQGKLWKVTEEGKEILKQSLILRSRKLGFLPGVDESFLKSLESKRRKVTMAMFKWADRENVENAFSAGYIEATNLGLPKEWAIKRGDEVATKTQYIYSKFGGAMWSQTAPGRILSVLTTWPLNWTELMIDWGTGRPSQVYLDYEKLTGNKVTPESWFSRRKQLLRYMVLVSLAGIIEKKTRLRALFYTGFTSLRSLANMAKGQFAGLDIPGSVAQLIAGLATADEKMIKSAWSRLRPDRIVIIARELQDIMQGKKDWLDLFFLMEKQEKEPKPFLLRKTKKRRLQF